MYNYFKLNSFKHIMLIAIVFLWPSTAFSQDMGKTNQKYGKVTGYIDVHSHIIGQYGMGPNKGVDYNSAAKAAIEAQLAQARNLKCNWKTVDDVRASSVAFM